MNASIYKSEENKILLTEEFLIFDKDKAVHFDHLLVLKMNKGNKSAYSLIGQYKPGFFFTYINLKADDLIHDLLKKEQVKVSEKEALDTPGRWGRYGEIVFEGDRSLVWYSAQSERWLYFKYGKSMKNRIGYDYLRVLLFKKSFEYISDNRKVVEDWRKDERIVLFDPFDVDSLDRHFESVEEFRSQNPNYSITFNERFGPKPANQNLIGCVTFLVLMIILMILSAILA